MESGYNSCLPYPFPPFFRSLIKGIPMRLLNLILAFVMVCTFVSPLNAQTRIKLATTTSTEDSGLLDVLLPPFEKEHGVRVDVIAVGTGKALKIAENGDVDVVLVHARSLEDRFVESGFGVNRKDVMYNDFVIVGPKEYGAGIAGLKDAAEGVARIASRRMPFISRGDESGTHHKEKALWAKAKISPSGAWYHEAGQGMGATIRIADEKRAYCLVDRSTFLALKQKINLLILVEEDPILYNPYGIIAVNPNKWPHVQYDLTMALIKWITSPEGQRIIAAYTRNGETLFKPLAIPE